MDPCWSQRQETLWPHRAPLTLVPSALPLTAGTLAGPQSPHLQSCAAMQADHKGVTTLNGTECPQEAPPAWAQKLALHWGPPPWPSAAPL